MSIQILKGFHKGYILFIKNLNFQAMFQILKYKHLKFMNNLRNQQYSYYVVYAFILRTIKFSLYQVQKDEYLHRIFRYNFHACIVGRHNHTCIVGRHDHVSFDVTMHLKKMLC
jgi:hypothetical protein